MAKSMENISLQSPRRDIRFRLRRKLLSPNASINLFSNVRKTFHFRVFECPHDGVFKFCRQKRCFRVSGTPLCETLPPFLDRASLVVLKGGSSLRAGRGAIEENQESGTKVPGNSFAITWFRVSENVGNALFVYYRSFSRSVNPYTWILNWHFCENLTRHRLGVCDQ